MARSLPASDGPRDLGPPPGVAISLATATFPLDQKAIVATVLLFLLANVVLTLPYVLWRRRLARSTVST